MIWPTWFARNVRHVCDGGRRRVTMYFVTVDCATAIPILRNSPWMRGAPYSWFARDIVRIISRTSAGTVGRPMRWRLFQVQNKRNPRRCHARTVAGCTMTSAGRHSRQIRANHTQRSRSAAVRRRRGRRERSKTCNWCRRARISSCSAARERISERSDRNTATTMGITVRRLFDGDRNLNESPRMGLSGRDNGPIPR